MAGPVLRTARVALIALSIVTSARAQTPPTEPPPPDDLDALFALSVDELLNVRVETASKRDEPRWRSPNVVSVVSGDAIRLYGHRTLADVLRTVVGTIPGFDGWRDELGIRGVFGEGTFGSRVLWLVDGHTINDAYFQGASPGWSFPVDVSAIERVEVLRGPGSALYGSNAFFAVVNVVTRSPGEASTAIRLGADGYASTQDQTFFGGQDLTGTAQDVAGPVSYFVTAFARHDSGHDIWVPYFDATGEGGTAHDKDALDAGKVFLDLRAGGLRLVAGASSVRQLTPDASFGSEPDSPLNKGKNTAVFLDVRHELPLGAELELSSRAYIDRNTFLRDWHYPPNWPVDRQLVESSWGGVEERLIWRPGRHRLLVGGEAQLLSTRQRESYPSEEGFTSDATHQLVNWAAFADADLQLGERVFLTGGGRLEGSSEYGTIASGRGALVVRPAETTVLKLQAGQGFKNLLIHDWFYHSSALEQFQYEIERLSRERVTSVELVWSQGLSPLALELVAFRSWIRDLVTYVADTDSYENGPGTDVAGLEAELTGTLGDSATAYLNGTRVWVDHLDGSRNYNSPPWSLKAGATARLLAGDRLALAAEVQALGAQDFVDQRPGVDDRQDAYALVNLNLTGRVGVALSWHAGVRNLLDTRYAYPVAKGMSTPFPGNGRTYLVGIELRP